MTQAKNKSAAELPSRPAATSPPKRSMVRLAVDRPPTHTTHGRRCSLETAQKQSRSSKNRGRVTTGVASQTGLPRFVEA